MNTLTKQTICNLLRAWINQRPGLEPCNYGFPAHDHESWTAARRAYMGDYRKILQDLRDARELLRAVEYSSITAEELVKAFHAFSGRLEIKGEGEEFRLEYCTGQYWPTEYRAAACAVLASALWEYRREDYKDAEKPGESIRRSFRDQFGRGIQSRWFS